MYTDAYLMAMPVDAVEQAAAWRARAGCGSPAGPADACIEHAIRAGFCPCIRCADGYPAADRSPILASLSEEIARRSRELFCGGDAPSRQ